MILLMLNGAFYCAEVIRLKWTDIINGCIVTHIRMRTLTTRPGCLTSR